MGSYSKSGVIRTRKFIDKRIEKHSVAFIGTLGKDGYPDMKVVLSPVKRDGFNVFYFITKASPSYIEQCIVDEYQEARRQVQLIYESSDWDLRLAETEISEHENVCKSSQKSDDYDESSVAHVKLYHKGLAHHILVTLHGIIEFLDDEKITEVICQKDVIGSDFITFKLTAKAISYRSGIKNYQFENGLIPVDENFDPYF